MLRTPLNTIGSEIEDLQQARVSIERTRQLLECQTRLSDGGRRSVPEGALEIELIDVGFAYQPAEPVLRGISLQLEAAVCWDYSGGRGAERPP